MTPILPIHPISPTPHPRASRSMGVLRLMGRPAPAAESAKVLENIKALV
jgi:hypothetical protein